MITSINQYKNEINEARFVHRTAEDDEIRKKSIENRANKKVFDIDAPTDNDVIGEDGLSKYKNTLNTDWLEMKITAKQPFFIMGHAGWGKTSIIKQVAKAHGLSVITIYLDKALPEDLGGIPIASKSTDGNTTYVDNALPKWAQYIYEHPEDDFLLFFDEMNQASPDVQNALMPILLESTIGGIKFDNIWFGAAGNFAEENASISDLSAPLRSRFIKENIWNENWEDAFEYITSQYKDKLPEQLLNTILQNNICMNPRELSKMLDSIIVFKNNKTKKYSLESIHNFFEAFNKMDKKAETKKIAESIFNFLYTEPTKKTTKATKKPTVARAVLSSAQVTQIATMVKSGGFINDNAEFVDLSTDWAQKLNLTPEEANLIKAKLATMTA